MSTQPIDTDGTVVRVRDGYPAVFTMHTPTGPTHACAGHARGIEKLYAVLGCHVNATKAPDGAQCANCVNVARATGGAP